MAALYCPHTAFTRDGTREMFITGPGWINMDLSLFKQ
jgi:hypothetical protein